MYIRLICEEMGCTHDTNKDNDRSACWYHRGKSESQPYTTEQIFEIENISKSELL